MTAQSIGDHLIDEANRKIIATTAIELIDWQLENGGFMGLRDVDDMCTVHIDVSKKHRITILAKRPDGETIGDIMLELQDGVFRVLAYCSTEEDPIIIKSTDKDLRVSRG